MRITVRVSQAAAIAAGHSSWGPMALDLSDEMVAELSPDERVDLAGHDLTGSRDSSALGACPVCERGATGLFIATCPPLAEATWPAVREMLAQRREVREAWRVRQVEVRALAEAAYQQERLLILDRDDYVEQEARACFDRGRAPEDHLGLPTGGSFRVRHDDDEVMAVLRAVNTRFQVLIAERDATIAKRRAAEAAAEAALEADKQAYRQGWVMACGDADLQAQWQDGLLCREDLMRLIANSALDLIAPADTASFCADASHRCGDTPVSCIPRRIFPAWRELKTRLPVGTTREFAKIVSCERGSDANGEYDYDDDNAVGAPYYVARVRVPVGPFHFERAIKLG